MTWSACIYHSYQWLTKNVEGEHEIAQTAKSKL